MSSPDSHIFRVEYIPGAGRGVVASQAIRKDTILLQTNQPAAHVVFWEYRKEACAKCFYYDRGRNLPFKHVSTGKVFCSDNCQSTWLKQEGELGLLAWEALRTLVQSKSKSITNSHGLPSSADRPGGEAIEAAWNKADEISGLLRRRLDSTTQRNRKRNLLHSWQTEAVDPDILTFLLSGILSHYQDPFGWRERIQDLELDERPYRSEADLNAHCNSFLQLAAIAPNQIRSSITPETCQVIISAASHNAFGIRGGSTDGEEYMGYALYPEASYFNHSCRPNIAKKRVGGTWEFRAVRDIDEGEQCCITYLGGDEDDLSSSERRQRLYEHWGFHCMCERC